MIPVTSSDVHSIGYDRPNAVLQVQLHSGGTYRYYDVPESLYTELKDAESKGKFLHEYIKYNYRYQKIS